MRKLLGLILVWQAAGNTMRADETFTLREQFPPGYQYHVSSRVDLEGRLTMPAEKGNGPSGNLPGIPTHEILSALAIALNVLAIQTVPDL